MRHPIIALVLAGLFSAKSLIAQTKLIHDDFSSVAVNGSGDAQTAVSGGNTYRQLVHGDLFAGSGPGLLAFSAASFSTGYIGFPPTTLSAPGDTLTLRFTIIYPAGAGAQNSGLRIGLYDTRGYIKSALSHDPVANPEGDTARGYFASLNPGGVGAAWSAGSLNVARDLGNRTVNRHNAVVGGPPGSTIPLGSFARTVPFGATPQTIELTIRRTTAGIVMVGSAAGEAFESKEDVEDPVTTFDTFIFGNGASAGAWHIHALSITTAKAR